MEKKILTARDSGLAFVLGFAFSQVAVLVATLLAVCISSTLNYPLTSLENFLNNAVGNMLSMLVLDGAILGVFLFFNRKKENKIVEKFKPYKIFIYLGVAVLSYFVLTPFINLLDSLFLSFGIELKTISYDLTTKNYIISIFSLAILPAICEELLFRGLILKGLKRYGKAFSIVVSAVAFAIFHMSYQQFMYPLLFGLLLGLIMYNENNIIFTIIVHACNNLLSLTQSYFNISLFSYDVWYVFLALILVVAFLCVIIWLIFKNNNEYLKEKIDINGKKVLITTFAIMIFLWFVVNIINK